MTVKPAVTSFDGSAEWENVAEAREAFTQAYVENYRGPQGDALAPQDAGMTGPVQMRARRTMSPELLAAHRRLGRCRKPGTTNIAGYGEDDPGGFGPALQLVTDEAPMQMESVTVLLSRFGLAYLGIMNPVFHVHRNDEGELLDIRLANPGQGGLDGIAEEWIHVQLAPGVDRRAIAEAQRLLPSVLTDAQQVARDTEAMRAALWGLADALDSATSARFQAADRYEVAQLLRWLLDGHFVLVGCQRCVVSDGRASLDESSRLGVLRRRQDFFPPLTESDDLLVLTQATTPSYLRYGAYPSVLVVRENLGNKAIEHRFVGMFTVAAMNANVLEIPVISRRVNEALRMSGRDMTGLAGQLLLDVIQTFPRSELFALDVDEMLAMATEVIDLGSRRRTLLFLRADQLGHFVSCLVYLPRDRYTTAVRLTMQDILVRELGGTSIDYTARVSESPWAVVHFTVRLPDGGKSSDTSDDNRQRIQGLLTEAARTWADRLIGAVQSGRIGQREAEHYAAAFPEVYKQAVSPVDAIADIATIEELADDAVKLVLSERGDDRASQLTWFLGGRSASLSLLLPMLHSMGVDVLEERPFTVRRPDGMAVWIYQFKISPHPTIPVVTSGPERDKMAQRFADAVTAIWHGQTEIDRFNELVLRAGLTWRQVIVVRAYAKYLRQAAFPYSQAHIESVVNENPRTVKALVGLFEALFEPAAEGSAKKRDAQAAAKAVAKDIDALVSLDTDRVLRAFASMIQATLRTNYFVTREGSARQQEVLSLKLNPQLIDEVPQPRPRFEIFVHSPRVEGVHLRFGHVARGGLRWSDRREDFRTEILGLVKAQAVKNAVIVPVGAKGGFVVKQPPITGGDAAADRDAQRNEGVACYKLFIGGLLDVTDNIDRASGKVITPDRVVRRDDDDAYLVVAADKGTATFSDIANDVAKSYRFWLGDAFASGGSVGYDHKAMGITAKGTWESVKRHFREMGVDTQTQDFTVVGIGDMSGDVFGNGMLLTRHIRLIAAFDHRHVFLDPDPDAARSWEERKRLFEQPRSSWEDYDESLISQGGGVHSREHKSIPVSPQVREALRLPEDLTEMTPPELIRAILCAPVDLLFNGGIGTYVKAESESNSDVGDRSNDVVRVNGNQVRAKVIGEGGNLGVTQLGRIEYNRSGGRINTDALDNSAGVDCSDHEVNIKILVDSLVTGDKVDADERTKLLESMTDEVERLVLEDNAGQNDLMGTSRANAASLLTVHARQIKDLVEDRRLNRELERLPSDKEIRRRLEQGIGLTSPELATLMAHVKLALKDDVLDSDLPDQDVYASPLPRYFPAQLRDNFVDAIKSHQLRREIVTTMLVNNLIDCGGITFAYRVQEDAGVGPIDAVRTFVATDAIFGITNTWRRIRELGERGAISVHVSDRMTLNLRRLLDRAARWLVNYRPQPLAVGAEINRFGAKVGELAPRITQWLRGSDREIVLSVANEFVSHGVTEDLAGRVAASLYSYSLLDIIDIADITDRDPNEVADTYYALMGSLGIDGLLTAVSELPRGDRWHALARLAIRDDIYAGLRALCMDVLAVGEADESAEEKIEEWEHMGGSRMGRARRTLTEIYQNDERDLAILSVAARQIRAMTRASGRGPTG
ncbi:NAD-glutamate dehydrogenase [Mycobacterium sp.]|uniref:NAD-glutamate dehydrogenase n=1 Tax=Mycobacterium sp. TaxID=1785 RepID=UPI002D4A202B|nr:NAD-glutamate dehydrogenase [Mycobacterium sp.]HZA09597.1 NAD-glutamate dehydrogenase [Mycobacterium sp.]